MDVFQALDSLPVVIERFKNLVAILTAVDFNILADILSGPLLCLYLVEVIFPRLHPQYKEVQRDSLLG